MVAVCFPADEKPGPGDRFLVNELAKVRRTTKVAVATKTDLVASERLGEHLLAIAALGEETGTDWAEIVPVSAKTGDQVELLADLLVARMPEGPPLYPDGELTDAPEEAIVAELIREAALEGVRDELPHSIAVVVEEMGLTRGPPRRQAAARHPRQPLRRARLPEGHRHRPQGRPPPRGRHRRPRTRSRPCSAPRSTSTCTSRSPRTGSATPASSASWASSSPSGHPCTLQHADRALCARSSMPTGHSVHAPACRPGTLCTPGCGEIARSASYGVHRSPARRRTACTDRPVGVVRRAQNARSANCLTSVTGTS